MAARLTQDDVQRLLTDPTAEARTETAAKIATEFEQRILNDGEQKIATDIFRALVKDAEVRVREALSAQLKSCDVLGDDDLMEILGTENAAKQTAIAQRKGVSSQIADALIDTGNETAVARLVANETAQLTEQALGRVVEDYAESDAVADSISRRPNLPAEVSERVVNAIAERLQDYLRNKHHLSPDSVSNVLLQARERATASLLDMGSSDAELERLVDQLHRGSRLSPWLLLRALCMGDMPFFEVALSKIADVPVQNTRTLIHDQGRLGLQSLYKQTDLPERLYPAFRAAVDVARETSYDGGHNDRERYVGKMIERMLTQVEDENVKMNAEDVDYLIEKLNQLAA
jgi:uncharacterized protein (DUF2336 family)